MGTSIVEFRQNLGGRSFLLLVSIPWLRTILMDGDILRPGWLCFQFQRLGLSDKIPRVVVGQF